MPKHLIEELEELRLLLNVAQTERYSWFKSNSTHKENCSYTMKAKELFEAFSADDIQKKIQYIQRVFYQEG